MNKLNWSYTMQDLIAFIHAEIANLDKQVSIASDMQASWSGKNEEYCHYWLGQKHAFKCKRADLRDRLESLNS